MNTGCSGFFGIAEDCNRFLIEALGAPPDQVSLLPMGVDTDVFAFRSDARSSLRAHHGIPEDSVVVMQTGKLGPEKDPITLARAAERFMAVDPSLWLVFVGSGSEGDLEALRQALGAQASTGRVLFLPAVEFTRLPDFYSMADVLVYPGGTSLSSLEAASCGRVVLMNDLPNSLWREELGIGKTFPLGATAALADLVVDFASNPSLRSTVGQRAAQVVAGNFSYDHVATMLERAMDEAHRRCDVTP